MSKLSKSQINAYGFYSFASNIGNTIPLSYLAIFLTDNLGYSAALMSSILLFFRILDFIVGLVSGGVVSKANFKWGKYRSWLIILRPVIFTGIFLQFLNTSALPMGAKVVITCIGYGMLHFSMNFIQIAQFGVLSKMAGSDMEDRSRLAISSSRWMAASAILTSAITLPVIKFITPFVGNASAYSITATVFAAVFVVGNILLSRAAAPYDLPLPKGSVSGANSPKVKDLVNSVATNGQLLVYILSSSISTIAMMTVSGVAAYYFRYVLGDILLMSVSMTTTTVFGLLASWVGPRIGKMMGKKKAMVVGLFINAAGYICISLFAKGSLIIYIAFSCVCSIARYFYSGFGPNYILDIGEYGFYKTGKDHRAMATGIYNLPFKAGFALGGAVSGYGLALIGYKAGMAVTPEFVSSFMWILGGIPAALYALSALIMLVGYKITDEDAAKYAAANAERMAKATNA